MNKEVKIAPFNGTKYLRFVFNIQSHGSIENKFLFDKKE